MGTWDLVFYLVKKFSQKEMKLSVMISWEHCPGMGLCFSLHSWQWKLTRTLDFVKFTLAYFLEHSEDIYSSSLQLY